MQGLSNPRVLSRTTSSDLMRSSGAPAFHWVYGLRVASDMALPGWPRAESGAPDVEIQERPCDGPELGLEPHVARARLSNGDLQVAVNGVGRFVAHQGRLIAFAPLPEASREDLLLYLTGAMVGAIAHQRGMYPLHASCVAIGGRGMAFAGASGAGKSTLLSALVQRGAAFVTDDVSVVTVGDDGSASVWPGAPRLKLDATALASVSATPEGLDSAGGNRGKFHLPVSQATASATPAPFHELFLLSYGDGTPRVEPLSVIESVAALVEETYLLPWAAALGRREQVFALAGRVARTVRVSRLVRPRGMEWLTATAELIERRSS